MLTKAIAGLRAPINSLRSTFYKNKFSFFSTWSKLPPYIALQAHSGHYVCAENGGGYIMVANRPHIQSWETFSVVQVTPEVIALRAHNGNYVCAERGGGDIMSANRTVLNIWEKFKVHKVDEGTIGLQTYNGHFVGAENGGGAQLVARAPHLLSHEMFKVVIVEPENTLKYLSNLTLVPFVQNDSGNDIFVKSENSSSIIRLGPGHRFDGAFDGIAYPNKFKGQMLKVIDRCDIKVTPDEINVSCRDERFESVSIPGTGLIKEGLQKIIGGWLTTPPDGGWQPLSNASKTETPKPQSSNPTSGSYDPYPRWDDRRHSDRERFERMDRNQYETWRHDEYRRTA